MKIRLIFFLAILSLKSFSQNTNLEKIALEFKPKAHAIAHQPIKANFWGIKNAIILFYDTVITDTSEYGTYSHNRIQSFILIPDGSSYKKILIDEFEDDNVETEILSVFFANADEDSEKELIILTSNTHRLQYLYDGTEYTVYFYDNFNSNKIPEKMKSLRNPKLDIFSKNNFEGFLDDSDYISKYKNAEDIKKELKQLGY